jgi:hypothetical protein
VPNGVLVTGFGVDVSSGVYVCGVTVITVGIAVGGGRDGIGVLDGSAVFVFTGVQVNTDKGVRDGVRVAVGVPSPGPPIGVRVRVDVRVSVSEGVRVWVSVGDGVAVGST